MPRTCSRRFGVPYEKHIVSAHRTPALDGRIRARRRGARPRGDHRRRGRRGASAGHDGGAYGAAGARRAGSERRAQWHRFAPLHRADAGRHSRRDARDRQGRRNQRGLLAVAILATSRPELREKLRAFREEQTAKVREDRLP